MTRSMNALSTASPKFEEILTRATEVFGSRRAAEDWLGRRALGLDGERPLDLLATGEGAAMVEVYLERLFYCVYT